MSWWIIAFTFNRDFRRRLRGILRAADIRFSDARLDVILGIVVTPITRPKTTEHPRS